MVPCGHCPACQQQKSSRYTRKIRNHVADEDYFTLFVTLNYSNLWLPYVMSDETNDMIVSIYRDSKLSYTWHTRPDGTRSYSLKALRGQYKIGEFLNEVHGKAADGLNLPQAVEHIFGAIGVVFNNDFQLFIKRLRQTLKRKYEISYKFGYFRVSEYGPTTFRPHFHCLLFFPKSAVEDYAQLRRSIMSAWPFCSFSQMHRNIEIAINPAEYVSGYVNRPTDFPEYLTNSSISQKHTHSKFFGFGNSQFLPYSILDMLDRRDLSYDVDAVSQDKVPIKLHLPLPKYVTNHYFPSFKGCRFLNTSEIIDLIRYCLRTDEISLHWASKLQITDEEFATMRRGFRRGHLRLLGGCDPDEYARLYANSILIRFYNIIKSSYEFVYSDTDMLEHYSNLDELAEGRLSVSSFMYDLFCKYYNYNLAVPELDYNNYSYVVINDEYYRTKYEKNLKKKKMNDYSLKLISLSRNFY